MNGEYVIRDMRDWVDVGANLVITDPPFGIEFDGKQTNYNRDVGNVVDGYVEWPVEEYEENIHTLLRVIDQNLVDDGQALIFSGWQNSSTIHDAIKDSKSLRVEGKLYWAYNFAPYCSKRPAHNVYEIYWIVKGDDWFYNNSCSYDHCQKGEGNLSTLPVKRDYKKNMPKYPTRLPIELVFILLEHFSKPGDLVFDPLAGSGMVGIASELKNRRYLLGDLNTQGKKVFSKLWEIYKEKQTTTITEFTEQMEKQPQNQ